MPSVVTGIIGGIQGAGAASDAADAQVKAAQAAGKTVSDASAAVNPLIAAAYGQAAGGVNDAVASGQAGVSGAAGSANSLLTPYLTAGQEAIPQLFSVLGQQFDPASVTQDPGYQFRLQEGQKALERSRSASGTAMGGAAAKALQRYGQDYASSEYQNAFSRFNTGRTATIAGLSGLAGAGLSAGVQSGNNLNSAARYGSDLGVTGAQYAGGAGTASANQQANNTLNAAGFQANTQMQIGNAQAAEHIGRANSWNNTLSTIGNAGNSLLAGGFSGGGGFSLPNMLRYGF